MKVKMRESSWLNSDQRVAADTHASHSLGHASSYRLLALGDSDGVTMYSSVASDKAASSAMPAITLGPKPGVSRTDNQTQSGSSKPWPAPAKSANTTRSNAVSESAHSTGSEDDAMAATCV